MSRTKRHGGELSPRRYRLLDWPPRRHVLRALWHLRDAFVELAYR